LQVEARDEGGRRLIRMRGRWTVDDAATLAPLLQQAAQGAGGVLVFDASGIESMDLSGAWLLHAREGRLLQSGSRVEWNGGRPSLLGFIDRTLDGRRKTAPPAESPTGIRAALHGIGLRTVRVQEGVLDFVGFLGAVTAGCGRLFGSLKRLRLPSVVRHVYETGLPANVPDSTCSFASGRAGTSRSSTSCVAVGANGRRGFGDSGAAWRGASATAAVAAASATRAA
jgi:phospholipid/cholesterol/gamma-HCH transport system permease protein